jgi:hypothetical protein
MPLIFSLIFCPTIYYQSRSQSWQIDEYFKYVIKPNIVAEYENYIEIDGLEPGIWQAGSEINLPEYNAYLRANRYWYDISFINWYVYPAPDYLKPVFIKEVK